MGDRSVTGFAPESAAPVIYLYSHWGATSQVSDLQEAIREAHERWDDPDYATRIAVSHLIGDDWKRTKTNYGLSVGSYCSPDLPYVLVVLWQERVVEVRSDYTSELIGRISFENFLALVNDDFEPFLS